MWLKQGREPERRLLEQPRTGNEILEVAESGAKLTPRCRHKICRIVETCLMYHDELNRGGGTPALREKFVIQLGRIQ